MSGVLKSHLSQLNKNDSFKSSALNFISVMWMRAPIEKLIGFIMHAKYFLRLRDARRMWRNAGLHFLFSFPLLKVRAEKKNIWAPDKRQGGECADLTRADSVLIRRRAGTGNLGVLAPFKQPARMWDEAAGSGVPGIPRCLVHHGETDRLLGISWLIFTASWR